MSQTSGLTIRQHARESLELRAEFVVSDAHREQVRFSPMSGSTEAHVTRGVASDISAGGMGLICPQFVPRMCEGTVRVYGSEAVSFASDGAPVYDVIFEHTAKVRRVTLETHDPSFAIGMAFIDPAPDVEERVQRLLDESAKAKAKASREGGPDG
ncbi:MAG: PilZ domain-containing protein [Phycisphaerales bacterium]|nr:PilZ domain-containing protein [Phycisphaerae bacterium]NNF43329.1 PilZ domain-containing protein [Phycisphaerales bacterium]NNM25847.1 PilZ domain-containing protein [Phycisphaerales bacterium]